MNLTEAKGTWDGVFVRGGFLEEVVFTDHTRQRVILGTRTRHWNV